jgi:hypothetical protein
MLSEKEAERARPHECFNTSRVDIPISWGMVWRRNDKLWAECEELDRDAPAEEFAEKVKGWIKPKVLKISSLSPEKNSQKRKIVEAEGMVGSYKLRLRVAKCATAFGAAARKRGESRVCEPF